jgi:hypothetical protein
VVARWPSQEAALELRCLSRMAWTLWGVEV